MNIENVMLIFGSLSGLDTESALKYRPICESSAGTITARAKNISLCDSRRLEYAAAVMAYYRYTLTLGNEDITVGEVSVKQPQKRIESAKMLLQQALADISDIYEDRDFVFERI